MVCFLFGCFNDCEVLASDWVGVLNILSCALLGFWGLGRLAIFERKENFRCIFTITMGEGLGIGDKRKENLASSLGGFTFVF